MNNECGSCGQDSVKNIVSVSPNKLGRCLFCVAVSYTGTVVGWAMFCFFSILKPIPLLADLFFYGAILFSLLLLAHMIAYTIRKRKEVQGKQ